MNDTAESVTELEVEDVPPANQPFADKVWRTLGVIDVSSLISEKVVKVKKTEYREAYQFTLNYISWVSAWQNLIECFPESKFEFDEPLYFKNGTGEQWITVRVIEGENELVRRWWLPYMDQSNRAVTDPSSTQINNTRMRVLVKCIAMCGLGIEVYGGEDIEDQQQDTKPTSSAPRKAALDGVEVSETAVSGYVIAINAMLPDKLATISDTGNVNKIHYEDLEDWGPITEIAVKMMTMSDIAIAIADELVSWRRSFLRKAVERYRVESAEADKALESENQ